MRHVGKRVSKPTRRQQLGIHTLGKRVLLLCVVAVAVGPGLCAELVPLVQAAIFSVDTTNDDASATACDDATPNDCSLRGAIIKANELSEASTINVPSGAYVLTQSTPCFFDGGATSALCLTGAITLVGVGAATQSVTVTVSKSQKKRRGCRDGSAAKFTNHLTY